MRSGKIATRVQHRTSTDFIAIALFCYWLQATLDLGFEWTVDTKGR
jgi:hypothetical protein